MRQACEDTNPKEVATRAARLGASGTGRGRLEDAAAALVRCLPPMGGGLAPREGSSLTVSTAASPSAASVLNCKRSCTQAAAEQAQSLMRQAPL